MFFLRWPPKTSFFLLVPPRSPCKATKQVVPSKQEERRIYLPFHGRPAIIHLRVSETDRNETRALNLRDCMKKQHQQPETTTTKRSRGYPLESQESDGTCSFIVGWLKQTTKQTTSKKRASARGLPSTSLWVLGEGGGDTGTFLKSPR